MIHVCRYLGDEGAMLPLGRRQIAYWEIYKSVIAQSDADYIKEWLEQQGEIVQVVTKPTITPGRILDHPDWWNFLYLK